MPIIDLHCHSNISDGVLSPRELVVRASGNGVELLALTDHDDCDGLEEARATALDLGMEFVGGVEISVTWRGRTIHVVGLNVDPESPHLKSGLDTIRQGRMNRARQISDALSRSGISGSFEGAVAYAENKNLIGRMHFARFLVSKGYAKDVQSVFRKFLVRGKPGHVSHEWAALADAVSWITASGGIAVIAHPGRYELSTEAIKALLSEFRDAGGQAIEVVTSSHTKDMAIRFGDFAMRFGLYASMGSDFHGPEESRVDLGRLPPLPDGCRPVWETWKAGN